MRTPSIFASLGPFALIAACGGPTSSSTDIDAAIAPGDVAPGTARPTLPTATGTCPAITNGDVTFAPAGIPPRKVKLAFDAAATTPGPLVLYWHATGSSPLEAAYSLGSSEATITGAGGVVASPYSDAAAGTFEWFLVNGSTKQDDFLLADEIVACLAAAHRIDGSHIHSMGMSAGALQTSAFSFLRSKYVASVATFSGGIPDGSDVPSQDPTNKFAALIFDGGTADNVFGVDFKAASEHYGQMLTAAGHFAAICDHGMGHEIPLDAAPSVVTFFAANGFGAWPSPYANGLPSSFPAYCAK